MHGKANSTVRELATTPTTASAAVVRVSTYHRLKQVGQHHDCVCLVPPKSIRQAVIAGSHVESVAEHRLACTMHLRIVTDPGHRVHRSRAGMAATTTVKSLAANRRRQRRRSRGSSKSSSKVRSTRKWTRRATLKTELQCMRRCRKRSQTS